MLHSGLSCVFLLRNGLCLFGTGGGQPEPEPELVREGALLLEPFDAPDVGAEPAEPELEPEGVMDAPTNPVGVGSCAKRSLDWKVTQFDDEGMRAV